jgi:hypothetical protein
MLYHVSDEDLSDPWDRRLEGVLGLILAVTCLPVFLYLWWREGRDERQWLKLYRSQWMATPAKDN